MTEPRSSMAPGRRYERPTGRQAFWRVGALAVIGGIAGALVDAPVGMHDWMALVLVLALVSGASSLWSP
jgi:hypothetical protein